MLASSCDDPGASVSLKLERTCTRHAVALRELDGADLQHLGAEARELEHLLVGDAVELPRVRADARVAGVDAVDVGVDLAAVGLERRGERDRARVGAAAAERRDVVVLVDALEAGDHDHASGGELGRDAARRRCCGCAPCCRRWSVTMRIWWPRNDTRRDSRRALRAIASSAVVTCSPVATSTSDLAAVGLGAHVAARARAGGWSRRPSPRPPRRGRRRAAGRAATRRATLRIRSTSPTEVPPYFCTIRLTCSGVGERARRRGAAARGPSPSKVSRRPGSRVVYPNRAGRHPARRREADRTTRWRSRPGP